MLIVGHWLQNDDSDSPQVIGYLRLSHYLSPSFSRDVTISRRHEYDVGMFAKDERLHLSRNVSSVDAARRPSSDNSVETLSDAR